MPPRSRLSFWPSDSTQPSSGGLKPCSCPAPASPCAPPGRAGSWGGSAWPPAPCLPRRSSPRGLRCVCACIHLTPVCPHILPLAVSSFSPRPFLPPPTPCPRGFSLGSPGSASSALVPSPNLPGCAGRGVLAAAEGEPAACAAPPQPQNNACRCQGDPNIFGGGAQEAIKNLQGCSEPGCPLEGRGMGESSRARRGKTSCPLPTPTSTEHGGGCSAGHVGREREERGLLRGQELCVIATAFLGRPGGGAGDAGMPRRAPCPGGARHAAG